MSKVQGKQPVLRRILQVMRSTDEGRVNSGGSGLTFLFPTRFPKLTPTLDKETERMKVELAANYYLGFHANRLVTYLSILVALIVVLFAAFLAGQIALMLLAFGVIAFELLILYVIVSRARKFRREVKYLDSLIEKLDSNESLGTLQSILDKAPK